MRASKAPGLGCVGAGRVIAPTCSWTCSGVVLARACKVGRGRVAECQTVGTSLSLLGELEPLAIALVALVVMTRRWQEVSRIGERASRDGSVQMICRLSGRDRIDHVGLTKPAL